MGFAVSLHYSKDSYLKTCPPYPLAPPPMRDRNELLIILLSTNTNLVKKTSKNLKDSKKTSKNLKDSKVGKYHPLNSFKKTGPPAAAPCLLASLTPLTPLGVKKILGGFWHLSQLKFEKILSKIPRMQILRKLPPPCCPPFTRPPGGQKKIFGTFLASMLALV